jgi:hypothetical protein
MRTCFVSKRRHAFTLAAEVCHTDTHVSHKQKYHTYHTKQWHISHTHTCTIADRQQHKHVILLQYSHLFWLGICLTFYTW